MTQQVTEDRCFHCNEKTPADHVFTSTIDGHPVYFCCPACLAITETIVQGGLSHFYQKREHLPLPPNISDDYTKWDDPTAQSLFVKNHADTSTATLHIEGMHCTACAWLIERFLTRKKAVLDARINYEQQRLDISWQPDLLPLSALMQWIADIGYTPHPFEEDAVQQRQAHAQRKQLTRIGVTGLLMMQVTMLSLSVYFGDYLGITREYRRLLEWFSLLFSLPVLYFGAADFIVSGLRGLRYGLLSMDVSVALALIGLFVGSVFSVFSETGDTYFDSLCMLCFFILLARFIEQRSRHHINPTKSILPKHVSRIVQDRMELKDLYAIDKGDHVLVKPGETIGLDGVIIEGESHVTEAMITGEAQAIFKTQNQQVFAGSQNCEGRLIIEVTASSNESVIANMQRIAETASHQTAQRKSTTDTISEYFTGSIIALSVATFIVWWQLGNANAFWIALSVLVISCPCALSLAAPTALSALQFQLRRQGILVCKPSAMDRLSHITTVAFDKTGTLTRGLYSLQTVQCMHNVSSTQCTSIASALEAQTHHPIAHAFGRTHMVAKDIHIAHGLGVTGSINNKTYRIGSQDYCRQWHPSITTPDNRHWVALCDKQHLLAWFLLEDTLRSQAKPLIQWLKSQSIDTLMLSGDASQSPHTFAELLDIKTVYSGCSSDQKQAILAKLQNQHQQVMMVGDGINDAQVLAQSHVSVTLRSASDWIKRSADLVLIEDNLAKLAVAIQQAKKYQRILTQNFSWALLYNALAIPFAMAGFITPWMAALGMSLSSIIVVLNSKRLTTQP